MSSPRSGFPGFGLIPILAALRAEIDDRKLGETERTTPTLVLVQRLHGALLERCREQVAQGLPEMTRHWFDGGPEPEVFRDARNWIGGSRAFGFAARRATRAPSTAASSACSRSAMPATGAAARTSHLQELQDHHIFPQAYLKRHGIEQDGTMSTRSPIGR